MRWTRTVALAGLCAPALAACGSSPHKTAASTPSTTPPTTSSTQSTPSTPSTATTTTTTSRTAIHGGICRAAGLHLTYLGGSAATGHGLLGFALKNVSASDCQTSGYPGVLFVGKSGSALPTNSTRTTTDFFGTLPLRSLTVIPGAPVSFRLGVTHFGPDGSEAGCTTAYGLQVIPANDTATLRVSIPQGVYECGTTTVSPLQPGDSAVPQVS